LAKWLEVNSLELAKLVSFTVEEAWEKMLDAAKKFLQFIGETGSLPKL